jgi:hypothetical protein
MENVFDIRVIEKVRQELNRHSIYEAISTREALCKFMEQHVYSVWDFMSLVKSLQSEIAPATVPWVPRGTPNIRRLINSLVLDEESDHRPPEGFASHFELYCDAMKEVGANCQAALQFVYTAATRDIWEAILTLPDPARRFTTTTFTFIQSGKPHVVAAAFAFGRENVIPEMFRRILRHIGVGKNLAPLFHFYLERHIALDEDFHGPFSLQLVNELCEYNPDKIKEAEHAAISAIEARIKFWDDVLETINQ